LRAEETYGVVGSIGNAGRMHRSFVGRSSPKGEELRCLRMTAVSNCEAAMRPKLLDAESWAPQTGFVRCEPRRFA
jgi:hypothetical protein